MKIPKLLGPITGLAGGQSFGHPNTHRNTARTRDGDHTNKNQANHSKVCGKHNGTKWHLAQTFGVV